MLMVAERVDGWVIDDEIETCIQGLISASLIQSIAN